MLKHGTRLMKKYNIAPEHCPNLARSQGMAFVRYSYMLMYLVGLCSVVDYILHEAMVVYGILYA